MNQRTMGNCAFLKQLCLLFAAGLRVLALETPMGTFGDEARLRRDLFHNHSAAIRPVLNKSTITELDITYHLQSIVGMDERKQILMTSGFLSVQWSDEILTWDPAKYGGQTLILTNPDDIWKPDITIINGAKNFIYAHNLKFLVELKWTGRMDWSPASMFETTCPVDVTLYPFDTQICEILITCWMYDYKSVKMTPRNSPSTLYFGESGEWIFSSSNATFDLVEYNGSNFSIARISFKFQRRRAFYVINVIVPVLCLSLLNTVVFLVPPESGEKMSLSITVVLAYSVFLSIVSADMPGTSNSVSYLAIYLIFVLVMGMVAVFMSAVVLWIFHAKDRQLDQNRRHFSMGSCSLKNEENRVLPDTGRRHVLTDRARYIPLTIQIDRLSFWSFLALTLVGFITLMALLLS